jgi:hypothetical protein
VQPEKRKKKGAKMKTPQERVTKAAREIRQEVQKAGNTDRDSIDARVMKHAMRINKKCGMPVAQAAAGIYNAHGGAIHAMYEGAAIGKAGRPVVKTMSVTRTEAEIIDGQLRGIQPTAEQYSRYLIEKQNGDATIEIPDRSTGNSVGLKRGKSKSADGRWQDAANSLDPDEDDDVDVDVPDNYDPIKGKSKKKGTMLDADQDRGQSLSAWDATRKRAGAGMPGM